MFLLAGTNSKHQVYHPSAVTCSEAPSPVADTKSTEDTGSSLPGRADLLTQKRDTTSGIMPQT